MSLETLIAGRTSNPDVVCRPSDPLQTAANHMLVQHVHALIAIEDGNLRGIVTDHDVMRSILNNGGFDEALTVDKAMTASVVQCDPDLSLLGALQKLAQHKIRHLVVPQADGYTIVSVKEILEKLHKDEMLELSVLKDVALAAKSIV